MVNLLSKTTSWRTSLSRFYALLLMLVLVYAGYRAAAYLFDSVFHPLRTPTEFMKWQQSTDVAVLRNPQPTAPPPEQTRAPLERFHRMGIVVPPDPSNGCTVAGCHSPLPHGKNSKIPAFMNLHVSFLACQSCHFDMKERPAKFVWIDLKTQTEQNAPVLLRVGRFMDEHSEAIQSHPENVHAALLALLKEFVANQQDDAMLKQVVGQLETSEPGSPQWRGAVTQLQIMLPGYSCGSYGSRLTPKRVFTTYPADNAKLGDLTTQALAAAEPSAARKSLNDQIHASVLKKPGSCLMCHSPSGGLLSFTEVGYSNPRANALANLQLARLMQEIREGKVFHFPDLLNTSSRSNDAP